MTDRPLTRRSALKMGAAAAAGAAGLGVLSCSSDEYELKKSMFQYPDTIRPVNEFIQKREGFTGRRPNVVVVLTDDMGYGDIGCYGNEIISTPNIDGMAREGAKFTDFYCSSPLCSPSRAGLLTGRYPQRMGITFPLQPGKDTFMRKLMVRLGYLFGSLGVLDLMGAKNMVKGLPRWEITIPEALKTADYATCAIGKWHLGDFVIDEKFHPHNYGFDHFYGFNASNDDWPIAVWRNKKELVRDVGLDQEKYTGKFTKEAVEFIEKSKDRPFFLYLCHKDPHQPCFPSEKFKGSTEAGPHGDTVKEVDWSVGEIMSCLKRNGLDNNTLVFFTSDNGPWFDGSTGGLRGRKGQSFEGGFRVPMIARWPGKIPGGTVSGEPAMNIDFFPTILDAAGLKSPEDRVIDGKSLTGLLFGKEKKSPHDALYFFHYKEIEGVRSGKWKYFRLINNHAWPIPLDKPTTFVGKAAGGRDYSPDRSDKSVRTMGTWPQLYNVARDRGESYNVIRSHPEVGKKLLKKLESFEKAFFSNPMGVK